MATTGTSYSTCSLCGVSSIANVRDKKPLDVLSLLLSDTPHKGIRKFCLSFMLFSVGTKSIRVLPQFGEYLGWLLCGQCITVIERDYVLELGYDSLLLYVDGRLVCESSRELVIRRLRSGV